MQFILADVVNVVEKMTARNNPVSQIQIICEGVQPVHKIEGEIRLIRKGQTENVLYVQVNGGEYVRVLQVYDPTKKFTNRGAISVLVSPEVRQADDGGLDVRYTVLSNQDEKACYPGDNLLQLQINDYENRKWNHGFQKIPVRVKPYQTSRGRCGLNYVAV